MCARPVIGIPADRRIIEPHPFHVVGEKYIEAVASGAGGLPLLVPVLEPHVPLPDVLDAIDGLFLTGSPSNVEPHRYRGEPSRPGTLHDPHRDDVTLPLITAALERGMPLFAVCRGFQEVNVALGGTLHQHVHEVPGYRVHRENHEDPIDVQYGPAHPVHLVPGGLLHGRLWGCGGRWLLGVGEHNGHAFEAVKDRAVAEFVALVARSAVQENFAHHLLAFLQVVERVHAVVGELNFVVNVAVAVGGFED